MISWYWLILAFVAGAFLGMAFLAACVVAGQADRLQEGKARNSKKPSSVAQLKTF
jgi:hypothetical protein